MPWKRGQSHAMGLRKRLREAFRIKRRPAPVPAGTNAIELVTNDETGIESNQVVSEGTGDEPDTQPDTNGAVVVVRNSNDTNRQATLATETTESHQLEQATSASPTWGSLWAAAYESLESNAEHRDLLDKFKRCLIDSGRIDPAALGTGDLGGDTEPTHGGLQLSQIQELAKKRLEELPEAHLSFSIGGKNIVVQSVVRKAIKVITMFKSAVNNAVSTEPHAALAWAGVMMILPLVDSAIQQEKNAADGVYNILSLLIRYQEMQEKVLIPEYQDSSQSQSTYRLLESVKAQMVDLYAQVYVYQIRFVLQYARNRITRTLRDTVQVDDWKELWTDIENKSRVIDQAVEGRIGARVLDIRTSVNVVFESVVRTNTLQQETLQDVKTGNERQLIDKLPASTNARFDSYEVTRVVTPCLEGTQQDTLSNIQRWVEDPQESPILWLCGMAGTGKTTVALTVANALHKGVPFTEGGHPPFNSFLGASFFFKQTDTSRNNIKTFFSTLAKSLTEIQELRPHIVGAIEKNLEIGMKAPHHQFHDLFIKPLSTLEKQQFMSLRLLVIVDALDECENEEVDQLLELLSPLGGFRQVQLRFLITSRHVDHIQQSFNRLPEGLWQKLMLEKIRPPSAEDDREDDITFYLKDTLAKIAKKHTYPPHTPPQYIDDVDIRKLASKADGLFIYAKTVCRFLDTSNYADEEYRQALLEHIFSDEVSTMSPQREVDEIYFKVLTFPGLDDPHPVMRKINFERIKKILDFLAVLNEPVSLSSLSGLIPLDIGKVKHALRRLHSVVDVPPDENAPLSLVHLSFRDFLLDEERSKKSSFHVEETPMHRNVFERCLEIMSQDLHQDMCKLVLPGTLSEDIPTTLVEQSIPPYLRYACFHWIDHLAKLDDGRRIKVGLNDDGKVHMFFLKNLLFWLEAMALIQEPDVATKSIVEVVSLTNAAENPRLYLLLFDARRFIHGNHWIMAHAPLQLYCSALIFSPVPRIRSCFRHLIPSWVIPKISFEDAWLPGYSILQGRILPVNMGNTMISGSRDGAIRLWDSRTGKELFKFEQKQPPKFKERQLLRFDDLTSVRCASISQDGKKLVYGWHDGLVKIWEIGAQSTIDLEGHRDDVCCVSFIPGSSNMVSSLSEEQEFRVWDVEEQQTVQVFQLPSDGPSPRVRRDSLAILPDGKRVARQLRDIGHIQIWDTETQELVTTLVGHTRPMTSLAFSVDGNIMVSSCSDGVVILWDVITGCQLERISGYDSVHAVALSQPDAKLMAIGLFKGVIELREYVDVSKSWKRLGTFSINGWTLGDHVYNNTIKSLWFSHDSKKLAVACVDDTTRLCNIVGVHEMPQNTDDTRLVRFARFLPGNDDAVISLSAPEAKIWDVKSAHTKSISEHVREIKFSPDQKIIALITRSQSVQLWDNVMETKIISFDHAEKISFSPHNAHMALYCNKQTRILNMTSWEEAATLSTDGQIEFWPNNQMVGWFDRTRMMFILWDLNTSKEITSLPSSLPPKLSPNGELLAFETSDPECLEEEYGVILLEVGTGSRRATFKTDFCVPHIAFHPEGHTIIVGESTNSRITAYETASGCENSVFKIQSPNSLSKISALAISPNGNILAAAITTSKPFSTPADHCIQFWDIKSGTRTGSIGCTGIKIHRSLYFTFSNDSHYVETLHGRLPLAPELSDQHTVESCLYVGEKWIVQGSDNLIWLPSGSFSRAHLRGEKVALVHDSNKFTYLKFDLAKTPLRSRQT